jgi:hypothetical protein
MKELRGGICCERGVDVGEDAGEIVRVTEHSELMVVPDTGICGGGSIVAEVGLRRWRLCLSGVDGIGLPGNGGVGCILTMPDTKFEHSAWLTPSDVLARGTRGLMRPSDSGGTARTRQATSSIVVPGDEAAAAPCLCRCSLNMCVDQNDQPCAPRPGTGGNLAGTGGRLANAADLLVRARCGRMQAAPFAPNVFNGSEIGPAWRERGWKFDEKWAHVPCFESGPLCRERSPSTRRSSGVLGASTSVLMERPVAAPDLGPERPVAAPDLGPERGPVSRVGAVHERSRRRRSSLGTGMRPAPPKGVAAHSLMVASAAAHATSGRHSGTLPT